MTTSRRGRTRAARQSHCRPGGVFPPGVPDGDGCFSVSSARTAPPDSVGFVGSGNVDGLSLLSWPAAGSVGLPDACDSSSWAYGTLRRAGRRRRTLEEQVPPSLVGATTGAGVASLGEEGLGVQPPPTRAAGSWRTSLMAPSSTSSKAASPVRPACLAGVSPCAAVSEPSPLAARSRFLLFCRIRALRRAARSMVHRLLRRRLSGLLDGLAPAAY
mmetsp:Transcript_3096/g.8941  ORF Transcript_3096/g.8941 Transcript_3096/m.8941 type:complete len:215 (+) Transcript_3096:734-1378(+)